MALEANPVDASSVVPISGPLKDIISASGGALSIHHINHGLQWADQQTQDLFGPYSSLKGKNCCEIFHHPTLTECPIHTCLTSNTLTESDPFPVTAGEATRSCRIIAVPVTDSQGNCLHAVVSILNVTEPHDIPVTTDDLEIPGSEGTEFAVDAIVDNIRDGIVILDLDGRVSHWNQAAAAIFGYSAQEAIGQLIQQLIIPERHRAAHTKGYLQLMRSELNRFPNHHGLTEALHSDGHEFDIELTISRLPSVSGMGSMASIRDVTEREHAHRLNLQNRQLLEEAQRISRLGVWMVDFVRANPTHLSFSWSAELYRILELDERTTTPSTDLFMTNVHPQDKLLVRQLHDNLASATSTWEVSFRLQMPDGRIKYVTESSQAADAFFPGKGRRIGTLLETTRFNLIELELKSQLDQQSLLLELGRQDAQRITMQVFLQLCLERTTALLEADAGEILEFLPDDRCLTQRAAMGWEDQSEKRIQLETTLSGQAILQDKDLYIPDIAAGNVPVYAAQLRKRQVSSAISVTIKHRRGTWGVISLQSFEKDMFSGRKLSFLKEIANILARRFEHSEADEQETLFSVLFESNQPMIILNPRLELMIVNDALATMSGFTTTELPGIKLGELIPSDSSMTEALHNSGFWSDEVMFLGKRNKIPIHLTLTRVTNSAGRTRRYVGHITDLSESRAREREYVRLQNMQELSLLTSGISHDFMNHLNVIEGNVNLLGNEFDEKNPLPSRLFNDTVAAIQHSNDLAEKLLNFANLPKDSIEVFSIGRIIRDMTGLLGRIMGDDINVRAEIQDESTPISIVYSDLESAILNLAINAKHAMPNGGELRLAASHPASQDPRTRNLHLPDSRNYIEISVSDTGTGIPLDVLPRIFEPLFTTREDEKGSGLGLGRVKRTAENAGGGVSVESKINHGTVVSMFLPIVEPRMEAAPVVYESRSLGQSKVIMVLEVNQKQRKRLVKELNDLGFNTIEVESQERTLKLLAAGISVDALVTGVAELADPKNRRLKTWLIDRRPDLPLLVTIKEAAPEDEHILSCFTHLSRLEHPFTRIVLLAQLHGLLDDAVST